MGLSILDKSCRNKNKVKVCTSSTPMTSIMDNGKTTPWMVMAPMFSPQGKSTKAASKWESNKDTASAYIKMDDSIKVCGLQTQK